MGDLDLSDILARKLRKQNLLGFWIIAQSSSPSSQHAISVHWRLEERKGTHLQRDKLRPCLPMTRGEGACACSSQRLN